jgi:hypothetical protein
MANTSVQREAEVWVVRKTLPDIYGQVFSKARLPLAWGGSFEFDAVSADRRVVACVSTSGSRTSGGKLAVGKVLKIKADTLYLLNAIDVQRRVLVFTDRTMLEHFEKERRSGRFPPAAEIELRFAELPNDIAARLFEARAVASAEVSPQ